MKKLLIFGTGEIAQLAHFYFSSDSAYQVAAFTVDGAYATGDAFCGLPVHPFEKVAQLCPPPDYACFVALSYSRLNRVRREKYEAARALGYPIASYVSSRATVLNQGRIGENAFILEDNTIQPFVTIGNNVTLWSGNHVGHHSTIGDHSFIASHVVISGGVTIGEQCFLGVNATLRDHIKVGDRCVVGAGTLLLADAAADSVFIGSATPPAGVSSSQLKRL